MDYQHILLAADLNDDSLQVAAKARELANKFNARLSITHIVESLPGYASGYSGVVDLEEEMKQEAEVKLKEFALSMNVLEFDLHLEMGPPKIVILDIAKKIDADLIVVGSHERHGLGLLLGSTASTILHAGQCDVLVVHKYKK